MDDQRSEPTGLTRRQFLLEAGAVAFATTFGLQLLLPDGVLAIPNAEGFLLVDLKKCQGCGTCMMTCALAHSGSASYTLSRIQIAQDSFANWPDDIHMAQCHQCEDAPCADACPVEPVKALKPNPAYGNVRMIDQELCIGCESCIDACPFTPARVQWNHVIGRSQKCDLCADTPYLGEKGGPGGTQACVAVCPVGAITFTRLMPGENTEESYHVNLRNAVWQKLGMTAK